jgi:ABC-type amino acid transport substrate-binding protein
MIVVDRRKELFVRLSSPGPLLLFLLALVARPVPAPAVDLKEVQARGTLRVIAAEGEQPEMFDFDPDPAKPGLEREMLEGFASLKRLKLEVVPVKAFADRIPALLRGDGDVVVGLVDTAERRQQIGFTAEVLPVRHIVVTQKPAAPVKSVAELRKRKTGTIRGTTWARETLAAGVPESQIEYFPDTEPMLEALADGRVDAVVMTISDFTLAVARHPGLEPGVFLGQPSRAAWGVRKQDAKLKAELDGYIENLRNGASWNRLIVKYFGEKALTVLGRR